MKNLTGWTRLAAVILDCRAEMRALYPAVDLAARTGALDAELALRVRELLLRHGSAFTAALKAPGGRRQTRKRADSWRSGGLWSVLEGESRRNHPAPPVGSRERAD